MSEELLKKYQLWLGSPLEKGSKMILERDLTVTGDSVIGMQASDAAQKVLDNKKICNRIDEYIKACSYETRYLAFEGIMETVTVARIPSGFSPSLEQGFYLRLVNKSRE